ncbi:hypothetical protein [Streptomyces sp. NPDC086787]|uniref:hypothetical protein n=1 Tax=Streptomyces sp. NPDC086787 TaxID=3365759 RepID=UPI0038150C38
MTFVDSQQVPGREPGTPPQSSTLSSAVHVARQMLDAYGATDYTDHAAVAQALGAIRESLRILLRALDAEPHVLPSFTRCPGGFVTASPLPDGTFMVEGWALNLAPFDTDEPRHEIAYHHIAATEADAAAAITECAGWLDRPLSTVRAEVDL